MTRSDSTSTLPAEVKVARVNYDDDGESLVSALQGQQFLVITLSVFAPPDTHSKIVKAAVKAGVPYIMPNAYGFDISNKTLAAENLYGTTSLKNCAEIESLGASYVAMCCGFWYEWSLALGEQWFGFDFNKKTVTFYDDGKTRISVSTWRQCGRALAGLLSLPENGTSPCVSQWKNKPFYIASFLISQRDMLDSVNRVSGTTDKDWEIHHEPTAQRYQNGIDEMQKGNRLGFAKAMYSRCFYPNGDGDYETSKGLANDLIGLPKEDLDEVTKSTMDMLAKGWDPMGSDPRASSMK